MLAKEIHGINIVTVIGLEENERALLPDVPGVCSTQIVAIEGKARISAFQMMEE